MTRHPLLLLPLWLAACAAPAAPSLETTAPSASPEAQAATSTAPGPVIRRSLPPPSTPRPTTTTSAAPGTSTAAAGTVTLNGMVYAEGGLELYNSHVSVQSLDPKRPFSARVTALKGYYTVPDVPASTQVKITASIVNYEIRTQMYTTGTDPDPKGNRVDFNGPYALPKSI